MKKWTIIIALILCVATFTVCMTACNKDTGKVTFDKVIANTNAQDVKKISTTADLTLNLYNYAGDPMPINQIIKIDRMKNGEDGYAYIEMSSGNTNAAAVAFIDTVLGYVATDLDETLVAQIESYLSGDIYIAARFAKIGDTINAQVQAVAKDEKPTFQFKEDGSDMKDYKGAWVALKYSDLKALQESSGVAMLKGIDLYKTIFTAFALPIDWTQATDAKKGKTSDYKGQNVYNYELSYKAENVKNFIKATVGTIVSAATEGKTAEESTKMNTIVEKVLGYFDYSDYTMNAMADDSGRLVAAESKIAMHTILGIDEHIKGLLADFGLSEEDVDTYSGYLKLMSAFYIRDKEGTSGNIEMDLSLNINEEYSYEAFTYDNADEFFTAGVDKDIKSRVVITRVYDEATQTYSWNYTNLPAEEK